MTLGLYYPFAKVRRLRYFHGATEVGGALGIGVGLGLQGVVKEFVSGLFLIFDRMVSVGDYILSGGEMAALTLLDACIRLLPGVMGAASSGDEESFESGLARTVEWYLANEWWWRPLRDKRYAGERLGLLPGSAAAHAEPSV